jgi:PKD repeat protein
MSYVRRGVLPFLVFFSAFLAFPSFAATLRPKAASRGMIVGSKSVHTEAAGIFFSGNFSYGIGSGQAVLKADTVTNPNGTATGPLRFALWFTPTPYPAAGSIVATYDITPSLAANSSISPVNGGGTAVPFTNPGTGCYDVSLVLEENVSGTWTSRDYGDFSLKFDIGNGCVTSFTASPTTVPSGSPSTLSWTTGGGSVTSVNIDNGVGSKPANGSATVNPVSTTTYTLSAFTTANSTPPSKQVTVTVGGSPAPTATFSASPTTINAGQSSTLTWTSTNATSVSIDNGVGSQAVNGSVSVSPASTTTYTLTATGPGGTTTKTATVTVIQPAPMISFSATPTNISAGQSSTLVWNTTNATSVTIDNGLGSKPLSGSATVSPGATTTYTLTATGPGGTLTSQATVTVSNRPSIAFVATPASIVSGSPSTLTWLVTNSTSVTIDNGIGAQAASGSMSVSPSQTTIYTLTATGPGGTSTATATVTVVELPRINFSVTPSLISAGGSATLSWAVTGVDSITIDHGVGTLFAIGTKSVSPAATTVYKLTATNLAGTVSATVTVTVGQPTPPKHRAVKH